MQRYISTAVAANEWPLNAICPYFTMFPLDFPLGVLRRKGVKGQKVLDPFCGRGTTNFAARILGLESFGVDSNPIAAAVAAAKLVDVSPEDVLLEMESIFSAYKSVALPEGDFWEWAFHEAVLRKICLLRKALLDDCRGRARVALRGIVLGALHGPLQKRFPSYLSNQSPRTYSPKPGYAVNYWRNRNVRPPNVDVREVIMRRAERYYRSLPDGTGRIFRGDSRLPSSLKRFKGDFDWVITSPPYYGMRTYVQDQWLRNWFLGGEDSVNYKSVGQLNHSSPEDFAEDLRRVWLNSAAVSKDDARLVVRFGGISVRNIDPLQLIKQSMIESGWKIVTARSAGLATLGKRQADSFLRTSSKPMLEYDIWAVRA